MVQCGLCCRHWRREKSGLPGRTGFFFFAFAELVVLDVVGKKGAPRSSHARNNNTRSSFCRCLSVGRSLPRSPQGLVEQEGLDLCPGLSRPDTLSFFLRTSRRPYCFYAHRPPRRPRLIEVRAPPSSDELNLPRLRSAASSQPCSMRAVACCIWHLGEPRAGSCLSFVHHPHLH